MPAEAARWAGPESAPMNRSARSSRAVVWVTLSRPVQSRSRSWRVERLGGRRIFRPADDDDAPAVVKKPLDERVPVLARPALGRGAGARGGRPGAAGPGPNRPACSQSGSSGERLRRDGRRTIRAVPFDDSPDGGARMDFDAAAPPVAARLRRASAPRQRDPGRNMHLDPGRLIGHDPQRLQAGQAASGPRAGRAPSPRRR